MLTETIIFITNFWELDRKANKTINKGLLKNKGHMTITWNAEWTKYLAIKHGWWQLAGWSVIIRECFNPNTLINSGGETICM